MIKAIIFDLDGVITDTANIHFKAWSSILNSKLKNLNLKRKFIDSDYYLYIDGRCDIKNSRVQSPFNFR